MTNIHGRKMSRLYQGMTAIDAHVCGKTKSEIGYNYIGRPIERITFNEEPDGSQSAVVYFFYTDAICEHTAKTLDGLAHILAVEYGVDPERTIRKGAPK